MKKTENFKLLKPEGNERYNIEDFNTNMDIIDRRMFSNQQAALNNDAHIVSKNNPHHVTKNQLGLENVDNTSDEDKPISILQQRALDRKQDVLSYDPEPAENSDNMVKSKGIFSALEKLRTAIPVLPSWINNDSKPVYEADEVGAYSKDEVDNLIDEVKENLPEIYEFDPEPVMDSDNLVRSKGIFNALERIRLSIPALPFWITEEKPIYTAEDVGTYTKYEIDEHLQRLKNSVSTEETEATFRNIFGSCETASLEEDSDGRKWIFETFSTPKDSITPIKIVRHTNEKNYESYVIVRVKADISVDGATYSATEVDDVFEQMSLIDAIKYEVDKLL